MTKLARGSFFMMLFTIQKKTNFLVEAEKRGHQIENGKMMFIYQAQEAFRLFTIKPDAGEGLLPSINKKVLQLLDND
jgi:shikimate dehydrogenase